MGCTASKTAESSFNSIATVTAPRPVSLSGPVRRIDALFCARRLSAARSRGVAAVDKAQMFVDSESMFRRFFTDRRLVRSTGPLVHSDILAKALWFMHSSIIGAHVKSIPIVSYGCYGLAVNASETLMAVTCNSFDNEGNKLYLYSLPGGELLRTIGGYGKDKGQFAGPRRVCFGPDDVIIVADYGNHRLQEFSSTGEYNRIAVVGWPFSVCTSHSGSMVAVGTASINQIGTIEFFNVDKDGYHSTGVMQRGVNGCVYSVCFTANDDQLLAISKSGGVSVFSVATKSFVRTICEGVGYDGPSDVVLGDSGEVMVAEFRQGRVFVFDGDGDNVLQDCGALVHPTALSLLINQLYVLDYDTSHVIVFV